MSKYPEPETPVDFTAGRMFDPKSRTRVSTVITHDRAAEALQRVHGDFGNADDLVLSTYIAQRRAFDIEIVSLIAAWKERADGDDYCDDGVDALLEVIDDLEALTTEPTSIAAVPNAWHPKSETPPKGEVCLLCYDVGDNTGAGLDEVYSIGWHDGEQWHDVHVEDGWCREAWLHSWRPITPAAPDRSTG